MYSQVYEEARDILIPKVGELHPYINRLYHNMGIYYEEMRDYNSAYDYFRKWYLVCKDLYGESHPNMAPAVEALQEYIYATIAQRRGIPVPSNHTSPQPGETEESSEADDLDNDLRDQLVIGEDEMTWRTRDQLTRGF